MAQLCGNLLLVVASGDSSGMTVVVVCRSDSSESIRELLYQTTGTLHSIVWYLVVFALTEMRSVADQGK